MSCVDIMQWHYSLLFYYSNVNGLWMYYISCTTKVWLINVSHSSLLKWGQKYWALYYENHCKKLLDCPCCCVLFVQISVCQMKIDSLVVRFMCSASFNIFPTYLLPSKVVNCYHTSIILHNTRSYLSYRLHTVYIMLAITLQLTNRSS